MNKKLQVFVSSTYTDLIEERQTAVEAILDAGHIPAGMELFKAGNESQLQTIYKWIDESDVYMLILGGRYGSVESKSGKSYTQLEYEYAISKNIPVFAAVLSDSYLTKKISLIGINHCIEQIYPQKFISFKKIVMSKIVRIINDYKDLKICVYTSLVEILNTYPDISGWVRCNSQNNISLQSTDKQKTKNNNIIELKNHCNKLAKKTFKDDSFDVDIIINKLKRKYIIIPKKIFNNLESDIISNIYQIYQLHFDWFIVKEIYLINDPKQPNYDFKEWLLNNVAPFLADLKLIELTSDTMDKKEYFTSTDLGYKLYILISNL